MAARNGVPEDGNRSRNSDGNANPPRSTRVALRPRAVIGGQFGSLRRGKFPSIRSNSLCRLTSVFAISLAN